MKNSLGAICVFFLLLTFSTVQAFGWTLSADFEKGIEEAKAQGESGFGTAGTATLFASNQKIRGEKAAKMSWTTGDVGFGKQHGEFLYPVKVQSGEEIWSRAYFYFASPWSFVSSPVVKILRIHIANANGGNVGYHSIFAGGTGTTLGYILASNEPTPYQPNTGVKFDIDKWQCLELYVKLSTTTPIVRIWKDGTLIFEDKTRATILSDTDYANLTYVMTYWNGGVPQDQVEYVDHVTVTTDKPSQVDSHGNPMLGPIPPPAPGGPKAQGVR